MRDQLHLMELVDRYLDGALNDNDRKAFEERLRTNTELRSLMEDQRNLRTAAQRAPVRAAAKRAFRKYRYGKWSTGGAFIVVVLVAAVAAFFLWKTSDRSNSESADQLNDAYAVLSDTTGTHLPPFLLMVDPTKDTTVITPNGIVLDIPRGAFVDDHGQVITTPVRVTLVEALDPLDIMKAGLSTMSGDTLLETGGMFYIDAQVNGKRVKIDPAKPLTAMVPATEDRKGMMLYQGVKGDDGIVDWRNPKPLKRSLVPVDITTLDFYPPGYEAKLAELGQDVTNKAFKDSLYYSFNARFDDQMHFAYHFQLRSVWARRAGFELDSVLTDSIQGRYQYIFKIGIDPAKVKVMWSPRFNNTNLATKAFEERMRAIHGTCTNAVLDAYVNALEKDLSKVDSQVVAMGHPEFAQFAERNDGRVALPEHAAERLRLVYEHWSRAEAEAIHKTQEKFWNAQAKLDAQSGEKADEHDRSASIREGKLFQKELNANIDTIYKQLDMKHSWLPRTAWSVPINGTGWWNVDKAVIAATQTRSSMSYTDDKTGKTATLTYTPFTVDVADGGSYEDLKVYVIPKQLNSFQRVRETGGVFTEKLNSIFEYDLVCLGTKDGKQQAFARNDVDQMSSVTATLNPVDDNGLRQLLRARGQKVENGLLEEARFMEWSSADKKRGDENRSRIELKFALIPVVFPCAGIGSDSTYARAQKF